MDFTDEERRAWHATRRRDRTTATDDDDGRVAGTCIHCGNAFSHDAGVVTDDAALCDVCNGN